MDNILAALLGYLIGSIPFGLLLTKAAGLGDVRQQGSGNIGATNVLRTGNKKVAAATLLLDLAKGFVPVALAGAAEGGGQTAAVVMEGESAEEMAAEGTEEEVEEVEAEEEGVVAPLASVAAAVEAAVVGVQMRRSCR